MSLSVERIISSVENEHRISDDDNAARRRLVAVECLNALLEDASENGFLHWVDYLVENEGTINHRNGIDFSFPDNIHTGFNLIVRILPIEQCKLLVKEIVQKGIKNEKSENNSQKALAFALLIIIFNVDVKDLYDCNKENRSIMKVIFYIIIMADRDLISELLPLMEEVLENDNQGFGVISNGVLYQVGKQIKDQTFGKDRSLSKLMERWIESSD